jgi:hypothetical protein
MTETTSRLGLPLLVAGQGQKDMTHNEALVALDMVLHPRALSRGVQVPPEGATEGDCWLVPAGASGAWSGGAGKLACWTTGGWRLSQLPEAALLWIADEGASFRFVGGAWIPDAPSGAPAPAVPGPTGGVVVDIEARAAIVAVLARLTQLGLLLP